MRLTNRERLLLIFLLFAGACYLMYQYVITPQLAKIKGLETARGAWKQRQVELASIDNKIQSLDTELKEINSEIQSIGGRYFSLLEEQEEVIVVLNEIIKAAGIEDRTIAFEPLAEELSDAKPVKKGKENGKGPQELKPMVQNIRLGYTGDYKSVWNLLRGLWGFEKNITITDFVMTKARERGNEPIAGDLTGEIGLRLYDMSEITQNSGNLLQWSDSGSFRKTNPFDSAIDGVFPGNRYILNRSDSETSMYVKFSDIAGHWAENAIDSFGRKKYISGDLANRYLPDNPITRGEMVMMLDKAFKWEAPPNPVDLTSFKDYTELGQSLSAMEKAFYKGYMNKYFIGYADGSLKPNDPITYEEFELVMGRILAQKDFKWSDAAKAIEAATGYQSPGIADSKAFMKRAEAVYYLDSLNLK